MVKERERIVISDDLILNLYDSGWSINDIIKYYKTSVRRVRKVLQDKGINTAGYRAVCPNFKECILVLVASGLSIRYISDVVDMSPHLIRQVMRDNKVNTIMLREGFSRNKNGFLISDLSWEAFVKSYLSGKIGFIKCAEKLGFSIEECAEAALRLSEGQVKTHKEKIKLEIAEQCHTGLSAITIAKKVGVSVSIVKKLSASS